MFRSGPLRIDVDRRELTVDDDPRHLEPQAFDLLAYLVQEADRVVPKEELLDEVWGDQFVSESALTTRIKEIRRAVDDDGATQRVIKNFRGRGYRFMGVVEPAAPAIPRAMASPLIGRESDTASVEALLEANRVVTIVGPGGVGKTSLASEAGRRWRDRLPDGVHTVRLARVREADEVVHAFTLDLGLDPDDDRSLASAAANIDGLIIVDNGEHVIETVATLVDDIVAHGGPARILTTSRERLGLSTEQVVRLEPLAPGAARQLLVRRAQATQPTYAIGAEDADAVDRLLAMLDHLPLAIEMAAPHLETFGPSALIDALTDRMDLLRSPGRAVDDRHRTLAGLVDWSVQLLDPAHHATLSSLTVFAGATTLADIAAVLDESPEALALGPLADLVDRSLIVADTVRQPTRYRLLETVRAALAAERPAEVDRRHAEWATAEATDADTEIRHGVEAVGVERLDQLLPEIRVAHRWARINDMPLAASLTAAVYLYAHERQWPEPALWCRAAGQPETPEFAAVLSPDAANRGAFDDALVLAETARSSTHHVVRAAGLDGVANVALYVGDLARARDAGEDMVAIGTTHDDRYVP